jgi:hypothetical protein
MTADPPTLRYELGSTVVPGDRVGNIRQVTAGTGTYVRGGQVYASMMGHLQVTPATKDEETKEDKSSPFVCSVELLAGRVPASSQALIAVGQLVVGEILRITPQTPSWRYRLPNKSVRQPVLTRVPFEWKIFDLVLRKNIRSGLSSTRRPIVVCRVIYAAGSSPADGG